MLRACNAFDLRFRDVVNDNTRKTGRAPTTPRAFQPMRGPQFVGSAATSTQPPERCDVMHASMNAIVCAPSSMRG